MEHIIHIHADAPLKPALGQTCNGCGQCCLAEPCPVGMLVSGRRHGACVALRWDEAQARYQCGLLGDAEQLVRPAWLARSAARLARRLIAAGQGCDADITLTDEPPAD